MNILIVDDEVLSRVGLRHSFSWEEHGYTIVGEAANGKEALEKIIELNPDIIITDIKMPQMDGLELIQTVSHLYPQIICIVLSCHNDFDYVKIALQNGAIDYLLKYSLNSEDILKVLNKANSSIRKNDLQKQDEIIIKILHSRKNTPEFQQLLANNIQITQSEGSSCWILVKAGAEPSNSQFPLLINPQMLQEVLYRFLSPLGKMRIFSLSLDSFSIFLKTPAHTETDLLSVCQDLLNWLKENLPYRFSIGICRQAPDILTLFYRAETACSFGFYCTDNSIHLYNQDLITREKLFNHMERKELARLSAEKNIAEIESLVQDRILEIVAEEAMVPQVLVTDMNETLQLVTNILISQELTKSELASLHTVLKTVTSENMTGVTVFQGAVDTFFQQLYVLFAAEDPSFFHKNINEFKRMFASDVSLQVSLNDLARFMNVSKNYASSLFKKYTGCNFHEYISQERMEKAKHLLVSSSLSITDIACAVGYSNYTHFSTQFKKNMALTPREYRMKFRDSDIPS